MSAPIETPPVMTGVAIEARNLRKAWGDTVAVDGISFTAPAGQFTVLLGPSGCGKSTTLRLIAGLEEATGGEILIGGQDVTRRPPSDRQIAMVFQNYALFPHLSVAENIVFGLKIRKLGKAEREERLSRTAELLGLSELLHRKPSQLSGGQQQRVALGRAIVSEQPICLMDEPLSNLDAKLRHEMRLELRALQRKLGLTMVYVTHDQAEAVAMADRIIVLNGGRIEQDAPPREIYDRPGTLFAARFIGTPPMNVMRLERNGAEWRIRGAAEPLPAGSVQVGWLPADTGELSLGLRPEDVRVTDREGLQAEVLTVEYLGADELVECRIGEERLVVRLQHRSAGAVGATVRLAWDPAHTHLFDNRTGRRLAGTGPFPTDNQQEAPGEKGPER